MCLRLLQQCRCHRTVSGYSHVRHSGRRHRTNQRKPRPLHYHHRCCQQPQKLSARDPFDARGGCRREAAAQAWRGRRRTGPVGATYLLRTMNDCVCSALTESRSARLPIVTYESISCFLFSLCLFFSISAAEIHGHVIVVWSPELLPGGQTQATTMSQQHHEDADCRRLLVNTVTDDFSEGPQLRSLHLK